MVAVLEVCLDVRVHVVTFEVVDKLEVELVFCILALTSQLSLSVELASFGVGEVVILSVSRGSLYARDSWPAVAS